MYMLERQYKFFYTIQDVVYYISYNHIYFVDVVLYFVEWTTISSFTYYIRTYTRRKLYAGVGNALSDEEGFNKTNWQAIQWPICSCHILYYILLTHQKSDEYQVCTKPWIVLFILIKVWIRLITQWKHNNVDE